MRAWSLQEAVHFLKGGNTDLQMHVKKFCATAYAVAGFEVQIISP